ncbi:hypothetical protein PS918_03161 [Pseudomonas fluorescens]|uniref:DUF4435 domain-containing protein n=1 Tax=Pseudomonas fluorescens TaxID=294 RepID=A0A5E7SV07_PSEFL|nr:DUF4435 domain-containing protein [Pseudomonas fluorescens]VVP90239.1 hypothetical protein PS918_03161 [Pseudomonas fluorescens]
MSGASILTWSSAASKSIGLLYRQLQPIEVYVEDSNSEAFYFELLNRMIEGEKKIRKIIPLNGRTNVLNFCEDFDHSTPALFIIDGDLDLFWGVREVGKTNLFQHRAYCIENYLICKDAAVELIVESSGTVLREQALTDLEWHEALASVDALKNLFVTFAAARVAYPELKTVSHGHSSIITQKVRKKPPVVDVEKIAILEESIKQACIGQVGENEWRRIRGEVELKSAQIDALDGVSGKDFLLPILDHFIRSKGCASVNTESLMFKLAKYCRLERLADLKRCLLEVMEGKNFISS